MSRAWPVRGSFARSARAERSAATRWTEPHRASRALGEHRGMSPFLSKKPVLRTQRWKRNGERLEHTPCLAGLGLVFRTKLTPNLHGGEPGTPDVGTNVFSPREDH